MRFGVGQIVKIVLADGSTYRVGVVVVPQFEHSTRGTCVGVRAAGNVVASQEFELVAVKRLAPATLEELRADVELVRVGQMRLLDAYVEGVTLTRD